MARYACASCGVEVSELPLTWTSSVERGETRYYCAPCAREYLRNIESRLDADTW